MHKRIHNRPRALPLCLIAGALALLASASTLAEVEAETGAQSRPEQTPPEQAQFEEVLPGQALTERQRQEVKRLKDLLRAYYAAEKAAVETALPDAETLQRQKSEQEAKRLARIPYSADKILLSGEEGNSILAHFSRRIEDPRIPENHRDVPPICGIKTRLYDTLVDSDRRSLKPVGKQHYIASVELQAGETNFTIKAEKWRIEIPENAPTREYIITFYRPPGAKSRFHAFAVEDFLTNETPLIPDWLPPDIEEILSPQ